MNGILRRDAMKLGLASLIAMNGLKPAFSQTSRKIKKSLKFGMIADKGPDKKPLSIKERLQIAKDAGFAGVEPDTPFRSQSCPGICYCIQRCRNCLGCYHLLYSLGFAVIQPG